MKKIVLISGKARHGKDTVADIMMNKLGGRSSKVAIAYYLKDIATRFYDWDGKKDDRGRHLMQYLGTDIIRNQIDEDFHIKRLCQDINIIFDDYDYIFIPDARFVNEIELPKKQFGDMVKTIRVKRDIKTNLTEAQLEHKSEVALDDYRFDFYLENNGSIEDLEVEVDNILNKL